MAGVKLVPYDESMHDHMVRLIEQDNIFIAPWRDSEFYEQLIEESIYREGTLYRMVVDSESGEFLGECEVHDIRKDEWEIGIKVLKGHWREGVGIRALRLFLAEVREAFGKDRLIARIVPDNVASVRLFQRLGAVPRRIEPSGLMLNDAMADKFAAEHPELVDDFVREMGLLFGVPPEKLLGRVLVFEVPTSRIDKP